MDKNTYPPAYQSWIVWGLGAALYFTGFYQRVAPAVMTDQLMADFNIGAAALGNFSAFYFYSYVAMQVPTGILTDHWGPRKLLTAGSFIAALGTFLFAIAPTIALANVGRLLIGGSVGVAWVSLLKLATHWFPPKRFAMTSGLALFCGITGAVSAGVPLRFLVDHFGWRPVMHVAAALTMVVTATIWIMVRDDPVEKGYSSFAPGTVRSPDFSFGSLLSGLREVFRYKNTWLLTLAPSGVVGPVLAFSGLWGVPFFTTHYGLSPAKSAAVTSTLLVAWAIGGPLLGALSDRIGRRRPLYLGGCIIASAGWGLILYIQGLPLWVLITLVTIVGFASGGMIIGFAFVKESVPLSLAGTVSGVVNMGVMLGPMILQPVMGWVLDRYWKGIVENGVRIYDLGAYHAGFTLMIAWSILAILLMAFADETYCRQKMSRCDTLSE
jgi:MFS family permease